MRSWKYWFSCAVIVILHYVAINLWPPFQMHAADEQSIWLAVLLKPFQFLISALCLGASLFLMIKLIANLTHEWQIHWVLRQVRIEMVALSASVGVLGAWIISYYPYIATIVMATFFSLRMFYRRKERAIVINK